MKSFLRNILLTSFCFWLISQITFSIDYSHKIEVLFLASFILSLINIFIKPILSLFFLPINLITLGSFRWVINALVLFLVTLFVSDFKIVPFSFPGFSGFGFAVPSFKLNIFLTFIVDAFLLNQISDMIYSIFK